MSNSRHSSLPIVATSICFALSIISMAVGHASHASLQTVREEKVILLGRLLFSDPSLSPNGKISCASCHDPQHAFASDLTVSKGIYGRIGTRNVPSLLNATDDTPLFWDGRRNKLQLAVLDPLTNPVEMGNLDLGSVLFALRRNNLYSHSFYLAFGKSSSLNADNLGAALAAYLKSLPRSASSYERYEAGATDALSSDARLGLLLFNGKAQCAQCHISENGRFTDDSFHHTVVDNVRQPLLGQLAMKVSIEPTDPLYISRATGMDVARSDLGRFMVTHDARDVGGFRTPSLIDVAKTAPYMHDGSVSTLAEAVDRELYYRGLTTGRPIALTQNERAELLAFLDSLTISDH